MENKYKYTNKKGLLIFSLVWFAVLIGLFIYLTLIIGPSSSETDSSSTIILLLCVFVFPIIFFLVALIFLLLLLIRKEPYLVLDKNGIMHRHLYIKHRYLWKEIDKIEVAPNGLLIIYFKPEASKKTARINIMYLKLEKNEFLNRIKEYIASA